MRIVTWLGNINLTDVRILAWVLRWRHKCTSTSAIFDISYPSSQANNSLRSTGFKLTPVGVALAASHFSYMESMMIYAKLTRWPIGQAMVLDFQINHLYGHKLAPLKAHTPILAPSWAGVSPSTKLLVSNSFSPGFELVSWSDIANLCIFENCLLQITIDVLSSTSFPELLFDSVNTDSRAFYVVHAGLL